jgi:hypothetical protein
VLVAVEVLDFMAVAVAALVLVAVAMLYVMVVLEALQVMLLYDGLLEME